MYRYKLTLTVIILTIACNSWAQTDSDTSSEKASLPSATEKVSTPSAPAETEPADGASHLALKPKHKRRHRNSISTVSIYIDFFSWKETVTLTSSGINTPAQSDLLGNGFGFEWEKYYRSKQGFRIMPKILYGTANIGGSQSSPPYTLAGQGWWGVSLTPHYGIRLTPQTVISAGPILVYRTLLLPVDPSGTTATSGSSVNYGFSVAMKLRLSKRFDVRQELGRLFVHAGTYWALGAGLSF